MNDYVYWTGGLLRKAAYASIGMTAAASVCYPHEAEDITKRGWHVVRDFAHKTYDDSVGGMMFPVIELASNAKSIVWHCA